MESVGPVDFGDSGPLPDFSRDEQTLGQRRIAGLLESSQTFPRSPQTVEKRHTVLACRGRNHLASGMKLIHELVGRFLPWFMPPAFHRGPDTESKPSCIACTFTSYRIQPAKLSR